MTYGERYAVKTAGVNQIITQWNQAEITYEQYKALLEELDEFIEIITESYKEEA